AQAAAHARCLPRMPCPPSALAGFSFGHCRASECRVRAQAHIHRATHTLRRLAGASAAIDRYQALAAAPAHGHLLAKYAARAVGLTHGVFVAGRTVGPRQAGADLLLRLNPGAMRA